jgi:hypothetical protein
MTDASTTDNFLAAWNSTVAPEPVKLFYRLYHDDAGNPLFYSMEDCPGSYIDIDPETYARSPSRVRVINGKLVPVTVAPTTKLVPSLEGVGCDPRDVCVIIDSILCTKWRIKTYESN